MKNGIFISLEKVGTINSAPEALTDGYSLKGYLLQDVCVGNKLVVARVERNGVETPGIFTSSDIQEISGNIVKTKNSCWKIEDLKNE